MIDSITKIYMFVSTGMMAAVLLFVLLGWYFYVPIWENGDAAPLLLQNNTENKSN